MLHTLEQSRKNSDVNVILSGINALNRTIEIHSCEEEEGNVSVKVLSHPCHVSLLVLK